MHFSFLFCRIMCTYMYIYIYICVCVWYQGSVWGWRAYVAPGFGAEAGSGFSVGLGAG